MSKSDHFVEIQWGLVDPDEPDQNITTHSFDTRAELNAFMEGVGSADGWMQYKVLKDSRELPEPPKPSYYMVRFYKRVTTSDRMDIIVQADSPEAARAKVKHWGETGEGLTQAEEFTETSGKEEIVDGEWAGLEEENDPHAVMQMAPGYQP